MKTKRILSGTLLIAGTTIGAGMLGIPLLSAKAGFLPAAGITIAVWLYMIATGFLFLEATLWMHKGANIMSMSKRFLGSQGKVVAGLIYAFLYYCLLIAYFAAGAPLFAQFIHAFTGFLLEGWQSFFVFGIVFGAIVCFGIKWVDRFNYLLIAGMVLSYFALIAIGSTEIFWERLDKMNWGMVLLSSPILFSSFGYHNVIPSLTTYFENNRRVMRRAILWGTTVPLIVYLIWQCLIIGMIPENSIHAAYEKGEPITETIQNITGNRWISFIGKSFGLFAIITSLLGVSFSMVDFLGDGFNLKRKGKHRIVLCLLTFIPPFIFAAMDPTIFVTAISIAGGFGEAFLNGILPVTLIWVGCYHKKLRTKITLLRKKSVLFFLFTIALLVICLEFYVLVQG